MIMSLDSQHSYNITGLIRFVPLLRYRDGVARELVLTRIRVLPSKHDGERKWQGSCRCTQRSDDSD